MLEVLTRWYERYLQLDSTSLTSVTGYNDIHRVGISTYVEHVAN